MMKISKNIIICTLLIMLAGVLWGTNLSADSKVEVKLNGLVCDFCAQSIKKIFARQPEVARTDVNLTTKILTLEFKEGQGLDDELIRDLVKKAGYAVEEIKR